MDHVTLCLQNATYFVAGCPTIHLLKVLTMCRMSQSMRYIPVATSPLAVSHAQGQYCQTSMNVKADGGGRYTHNAELLNSYPV